MAMNYVHIWLGNFRSLEAFKDYFKEYYDEDGELPINQFAADQGEVFYDHDWVESGFDLEKSIDELVHNHSYSGKYGQEVLEKARSLGIETANTFILADSKEFSAPKSRQAADYSLIYLGKFKADI